MYIKKQVNDFEKGNNVEDIMLQHKRKNRFMKLEFNEYEGVRDVYVREIVKNEIGKGGLSVGNTFLDEGEVVYVECNYESPTIYGHRLRKEQLIKELEQEYEEIGEDSVEWVSNMDKDWEILVNYLK